MYGEERDRYLSDRDAKAEILEVGRRMYAKNYVVSNDGNITCKDHNQTDPQQNADLLIQF